MAMAAMIKMGIVETHTYPRISPAIAIPAPFNRPALARISARDQWPKTTARMEAGEDNEEQAQNQAGDSLAAGHRLAGLPAQGRLGQVRLTPLADPRVVLDLPGAKWTFPHSHAPQRGLLILLGARYTPASRKSIAIPGSRARRAGGRPTVSPCPEKAFSQWRE